MSKFEYFRQMLLERIRVYDAGSPVSSIAEDSWSSVEAREILKLFERIFADNLENSK